MLDRGVCKTLTYQTWRRLSISCECTSQAIRKFDKFHTVATKPDASRTLEVTECQK